MSLNQDDLRAIKSVVQQTVQPMLVDMEGRLAGSIEALAQDTAAGFAEVHEKLAKHDKHFERIDSHLESIDARLDRVDADLNRIENKLDATIDRVDSHEVQLRLLLPKAA